MRNYGKMKKNHSIIIAAMLVLVSGCYTPKHSNVLIFATNTKLGVDLSYDPKTQEPSLVVGFRRQEGVWMPLLANYGPDGLEPGPLTIKNNDGGGAGAAAETQVWPHMLYQGNDDKKERDTYSVLATFKGKGAASTSGSNSLGASGAIAQFFATGLAARELAQVGGAALVSTKAPTPGQTAQTNLYAPDNSSSLLSNYWSPKVSGTVATTAGSSTVVGTGTRFTKEVAIGDKIAADIDVLPVTAIADDTHLTTGGNFTNNKSGSEYQIFNAKNQKAMEDWLTANKMGGVALEIFIDSGLFSDARKKAVQDLKIQSRN